MANPVLLIKAAAILSDENGRKTVGWIVAAILSPVIVVIALLLSLGTGTANQNVSIVQLCFYGGVIPEEISAEYGAYIEDMRASFELLDEAIAAVNEMAEENAEDDDSGLDDIRVKAIFYALFFGADSPSAMAHAQFVDCFVTCEERTRTITTEDEDGNEVETEEVYTAAVPIDDLAEVYANIAALLGLEITEEQKANADSIYSLIRYGYAGGGEGWIDEAGLPFIGVNGFCSPVGENWRNIVTSEFGYRSDPFTGERKGHSGMDLAVPTGTAVRAAMAGTVTVSTYNAGGYGYYVMIDHGGGLSTLYGHCSQLLVSVGQEIRVGDIIALSGSTGRSTGPHLHFEVRVNGERTNPRLYLP